jgi:cyclophilin family peptidyl-prolyl cis-trans isomerase
MHRLAVNGSIPFVLQGGGYYPQYIAEPNTPPLKQSLNPGLGVDLDGNYATPNPTVNSEFNNAPLRPNFKGTIAMAQAGTNPNSASNQYFINLNDNSSYLDFLNGGFTVFAKVAGDGMSLIDIYANQLVITNLNPDTDDNGTREAGPFGEVPILFGSNSFLPLIVNQAKVVDYLGTSIQTSVPASGLTIANKDMFMDTGSTLSGTGALTIGVGRTLGARENYVITRPVINHGTLAPGLSIGVMGIYAGTGQEISTDYEQWFDGTLSLQLSGTTADTQYDKLVINSQAKLAGKLQVSSLGSFTPALGNSFTVLTAAQIIGAFNTYDLPQLASGQAWKIMQSLTAISLTVVAGDYNRNGVIDADDYVVWRKSRNKSVTAWSGADGNGDGLVNDLDFTVWRNNLGAIGGGIHGAGAGASDLAISNVPEPTTGVLAVLAIVSLTCIRHRSTIMRIRARE